MSLKARLEEDMKNAMRARESGKLRLSVIRMARSSMKNLEIDEKRELNEDEVLAVLVKEVKMRKDSLEEFVKADRKDLIDLTQQELDILMEYMPKQLTTDEIRTLVSDTIKQLGASSPKDMGKVMASLAPQVKGRADGKEVSNIVKELLNS